MNTSKQINVIVALVFAAVIATGVYTMWDPTRSADAKDTQLESTITRGAFLFAQNCIVCHGDKGEGGAVANRLKLAPPLNGRNDLQGKDLKTGQVDAQAKALAFKLVTDTITCGRIGKSMPPWAIVNGGTLNDDQIRQLATFITEGTGWDQAQELAVHGDHKNHILGYDSDHMTLAQGLTDTSTTVYLNLIDPLGKGSRIEIDGELMLITANPDKDNKSVEVTRALGTTKAKAHDAGAQVLKPPVPPDPPSVTGASTQVCGQRAASAVATVPAVASDKLTITASAIAWNTDTLLAPASVPLTLTVQNNDAGIPHNFSIYKGKDATGDKVAGTEIATGVVTQTLNFGPLDAGSYYYQCDVHTQMQGTLTVQAAGAGGAATPAASTPAASGTVAPTAAAAGSATPVASSTP
jgi:mono/diheme cytochrome c family protein/plastocyanin